MTGPLNTRRTVLGLLAGAGAGGLAASAASARQQPPITSETLSGAERMMGVSYTASEREQMLNGVEAWVSRAERLRAVEKPNDLAPALTFDPRLPGRTYRAQDTFVSGLPINAGPAPSDPADIAYAPVWKQASWMAAGALSSVELTEIYLDRIARHGEALECYVTVTADHARRQAAQMDAERARGEVRGPLHGVPYALKDIIDVADVRASWGASVYQDRIADETAVVAQRLEAAGAVLLGKATSGALAYGDIWFDGVTRNPFNPNEGSSGSSAGPASATAAGLCAASPSAPRRWAPSFRRRTVAEPPACVPTFGRVARTGAMALCWSLDKIGPSCVQRRTRLWCWRRSMAATRRTRPPSITGSKRISAAICQACVWGITRPGLKHAADPDPRRAGSGPRAGRRAGPVRD
jgi:hypothetical protein